MSKRDLKKYIASMTKEQLEEQFVLLYEKFPDVKTYYNFVFNPKEEKLADEAKAKISNEYFPVKGRRPKLRRTVAQKFVKHFITLGVDPIVIADVMLFTIETAQKYSARRQIKYASFYNSILTAYKQAIDFTVKNGIYPDFRTRITAIPEVTKSQRWENQWDFQSALAKLDDAP